MHVLRDQHISAVQPVGEPPEYPAPQKEQNNKTFPKTQAAAPSSQLPTSATKSAICDRMKPSIASPVLLQFRPYRRPPARCSRVAGSPQLSEVQLFFALWHAERALTAGLDEIDDRSH